MNSISLSWTLLKKVPLLALWSALLALFAMPALAQTTYTSDTNIADFTSQVSSYATLSNYSGNQGCTSPTFLPTASELATTGCRVYDGTFPIANTNLPSNNWILATFSSPVSSILVFPNIDHLGSAYDGYQYQIYGSNDGVAWTFLFDVTSVNPCGENTCVDDNGEPFTLGSFTGTAPGTVNNVLTPQSVGLATSCSGTATPCAIGYIAQFNFSTAYTNYAFGASTYATGQGNADQELSAVGAAQMQVNPIPPEGTISVANDFSTPTGTIMQNIIIPSSNNNPNGSNEISSTNQPIPCDPTSNPPYAIWRQFVVGTPWAVSHCAPHAGNGTNLGSLYVNACWNSTTQSLANASDAFCPTVDSNGSQGDIILEDTFDWTKESIVNGATASLIAFSPPIATPGLQWTTSTTSTNPVCPEINTAACFLFDTLYEMFGDQTTTRGKSPKSKSWNVSALDVPIPLTSVYAAPNSSVVSGAPCPLKPSQLLPLNDTLTTDSTFESPTFTVAQNQWFNGNCLVDFVVNQAVVPPSLTIPVNGSIPANNNFVAALVSGFAYGPGAQSASTDVSLTNTSPSAQWSPLSGLPAVTLGSLAGNYNAPAQSLHWSSVDTAGISEKNIQLVSPTPGDPPTCPVPADVTGGPIPDPAGGQCYVTSDFTVEVNLDSTSPTISIAAPTAGQTFAAYSSQFSSFTCADVPSGVASCNGTSEPGVPSVILGSPLDTTPNGAGKTLKTLTVGAGNNTFDEAGNVAASQSVNYYVSCEYASVLLNSTVLTKGLSFDPAATMLTDCMPTAQKVWIEFTLTGPFGRSCANSTQLLFFPIPVTIPANTNKSPLKGVLLFVPGNACSGGGFTFSTNTYNSTGSTLLGSVTQAVSVK
jgi:hypothetical protein